MSSDATLDPDTLAGGDTVTDTHHSDAGEAIAGLLNDIVITHVLRSEHFDDPADLARLPAVPCGESRDARRGGGDGAAV